MRSPGLRRGAEFLGLASDGNAMVVIVVFAPAEPASTSQSHHGTAAEAVRRAAADAGAGAIGQYRACSFSTQGMGRFEPMTGAQPAIGSVGRLETVMEERIEVVAQRRDARRILQAMLAAHPYEEPAFHVYATIAPQDL